MNILLARSWNIFCKLFSNTLKMIVNVAFWPYFISVLESLLVLLLEVFFFFHIVFVNIFLGSLKGSTYNFWKSTVPIEENHDCVYNWLLTFFFVQILNVTEEFQCFLRIQNLCSCSSILYLWQILHFCTQTIPHS